MTITMDKKELQQRMKSLGLTYKELAEELGYAPYTVNEYLWRKRRKPSKLFILKFKELEREKGK